MATAVPRGFRRRLPQPPGRWPHSRWPPLRPIRRTCGCPQPSCSAVLPTHRPAVLPRPPTPIPGARSRQSSCCHRARSRLLAHQPRLRHPLTVVTVRCLLRTRSIQVPCHPRALQITSTRPDSDRGQDVTVSQESLACCQYVRFDGSELDLVPVCGLWPVTGQGVPR